MSPRAACRLEALGFAEVYDYELGISDWKAAGLPSDGEGVAYQMVADAMRGDVPTCRPDETVGEVKERVLAAGWEDCLVLECGNLVTGRLRRDTWEKDSSTVVGEVMQVGPTTVRPSEPLERLARRMDRRPTDLVAVATAQGELLGVVKQDEAHRVLEGEAPELIWADCDGCPGQWQAAGAGL